MWNIKLTRSCVVARWRLCAAGRNRTASPPTMFTKTCVELSGARDVSLGWEKHVQWQFDSSCSTMRSDISPGLVPSRCVRQRREALKNVDSDEGKKWCCKWRAWKHQHQLTFPSYGPNCKMDRTLSCDICLYFIVNTFLPLFAVFFYKWFVISLEVGLLEWNYMFIF